MCLIPIKLKYTIKNNQDNLKKSFLASVMKIIYYKFEHYSLNHLI